MKSKILISILAIALVCGCVIPGLEGVTPTLGAGLGLEITSFTVEPSTVFSGASVRVIMETANQGGTTVEEGDAMVYLTSSNSDEWDSEQYYHFEKQMKAEDVVRGIPADTKRISFPSLTAPDLTPGQTRSDIFIGRIYHEYETSARGSIWIYDETESDAARAAGRSLYSSSFTYTKGPVGLQISVSPSPLVLYGDEDTFTVYIKINNLATGTIYSPGSVIYTNDSEDIGLEAEEINRVDVNVTTDDELSGYETDCEGTDQELVAGRDLTLVCEVTVDSRPDTFKSYSFDVTVNYGYYTERTATVTVQGR